MGGLLALEQVPLLLHIHDFSAVFTLTFSKSATEYVWDPNPSVYITTFGKHGIESQVTMQPDEYIYQSISSQGTLNSKVIEEPVGPLSISMRRSCEP